MDEERAKDVQEVVDFAKGGSLLQRFTETTEPWMAIEHDFGRAMEAAQSREYRRGNEAELNWANLRSIEEAEIRSRIQLLPDGMEAWRHLKALAVDVNIGPDLSNDRRYEAVADDIGADLMVCLWNRFLNGTRDCFFERIFQAYKSGGWPCGIEGELETGNYKVIVYRPLRRD